MVLSDPLARSVDWPILTLRDAGVQLIDCVHKTPAAQESGYPYIGIPQMKSGRLDFDVQQSPFPYRSRRSALSPNAMSDTFTSSVSSFPPWTRTIRRTLPNATAIRLPARVGFLSIGSDASVRS